MKLLSLLAIAFVSSLLSIETIAQSPSKIYTEIKTDEFTDEPIYRFGFTGKSSSRLPRNTLVVASCSRETYYVTAVVGLKLKLETPTKVKYRVDQNPTVTETWDWDTKIGGPISFDNKYRLFEQMRNGKKLVIGYDGIRSTFQYEEPQAEVDEFLRKCANVNKKYAKQYAKLRAE